MITRRGLAPLALLLCGAAAPEGKRLGVAFDTEWSALDPHYHSSPLNLAICRAVFDPLVRSDPDLTVRPCLAESWRALDDQRWEFRLRQGVRFQDGSPVTSNDVAASIARVPRVPNSPGPLTPYTRAITRTEPVDDRTIVFHTSEPAPFLPALLTYIYIIPARIAAGATTKDFNQGGAMVGSGPYRFVRYTPGDRLVLARSDSYWGAKPAWNEVEVRIITNGATREAALLSGDVDFILNPQPASVDEMAKNPALTLYRVVSTRITYVQFNQRSDALPDVKGTNGRNPFADARVRRAVSLAIPRQRITERVMDGLALPTGQMVAPGQFGHDPKIPVSPYDPTEAKRLLTEAGFGSGVEVSIATPSDRNIDGVQVVQAIAAALTRLGMRTTVNAVPVEVYLANWRKGLYSFYMHGAGPVAVAATLVPQMVGTKDPGSAMGVSNESGYSNPALDAVMRAALQEIDDTKRQALFARAAEMAEADTAIIPLYHEYMVWASRKGLEFKPRSDSLTLVQDIAPA